MPRITANEIITQKHVRFFVQPGGPGPGNDVFYSGQDATYMSIESWSNPQSGGINPINVHDPQRQRHYRRIGRTVEPPDLPTFTARFYQKQDVLPRHLVNLGDCVTNFYQVVGDCKDLSNFTKGWTSYVKIGSYAELTTPTEAGGSFDSDDALMDELEFTSASVYNVGKMAFSEKATTQVYSEIIDIVYGSRVQCGNCGPDDDGTKLIYAVANNTVASPGQAPSIFYSTNGGTTFTELAITGAVSTDVPEAIDVVGNFLVVLFDNGTTGGYFYTEINSVTGIPDSTWTKVTTGFVSARAPKGMWGANGREVWICGEGGYIYKVTNLSSGASVVDAGNATTVQLNRIHGNEEIIVAAGEAVVIYSINRGVSFAATSAAPSGDGHDAVWVKDNYLWWVGDDAGDVYYTLNQGVSWLSLAGITATEIHDIRFSSDEVGFIACLSPGPVAKLYTTFDGGNTWSEGSPRLINLPTFDRPNRLAVPEVPNLNIAVNNLAVGGLAGNGSDGIILIASSAVL